MTGKAKAGKFCLSDNKVGQSPVTVIILGWAWSKDYQVERFAKLHRDLGHHTLTYILDPRLLFSFDYKEQREISEKLIDQVKADAPDVKDVFLHAFSNNGYCLYQHLGEMITADSDLKLCGAVLDSTPCPWTYRAYLLHHYYAECPQSIMFALLGFIWLHWMEEKAGIIAALKAGWELWPLLRANMSAYSSIHSFPGYHFLHEQLKHPLLLIFSPGDRQMPTSFIRYCAEKHRSLGRMVIEEDFGKSGHVAHHKSNPERYRRCVQDFVRETMAHKGEL